MESLETQYVRDVERHKIVEQELGEAERLRDQEQLEFARIRECHTPRPSWDQVIAETPELSSQRFDWDLLLESATTSSQALMQRRLEAAHGSSGDSVEDSDTSDEDDDDLDDDNYLDDEANGDGHGPPRVTTTQQLVREILQWIERLQKHCGVNLHLSRIWHDIEAARVELNILHHQLERAMRKRNKFSLQNAAVAMGIDLAPSKKNTKQEYIVVLGIHDEIPPFLRHQGKIKYRALKKSDIENFVRKVWVEKRKRERRNPLLRVRLEEIIYEKLQRKYGFQPLVAEWGYNTLLALNMFAWDAEIELFLLCLTDAVSDQVYVDQEVMIQTCHALLLRLSTTYYNESFVSERRVLLKDALVTLRKFFPLKTSIQLQALEKAMIRDMHKMKRGGNDSILYIDDIFPMNMSYPRGFFVKTMRTQHFKEIQEYYSHLVSEMGARDTKRTGELLVAAVKEAMLAIDPLADPNAVYAALMRGVGAKTRAQLKMYEIVNYRGLLRKMNRTGLLKFALNFDPRAEVNWQRRKSVDTTVAPANTESPSEPLPRRVSVMPTRLNEDASS
ncbi:hypothetical protein Poli38472_005241 [Pythium oligandrum]|uniref:Uncharacterized protein n=1 Tax=Pythium oligandrum TaxID=41045 RepID=A0A8K1FLF3_PYTOL|nr:hypothetical protein Poli38472_005241 [Pythium oligandrum]|eukprot:TMW62623.1 hypothetical protein Poli38472_005241 [Pythium oligandrum]